VIGTPAHHLLEAGETDHLEVAGGSSSLPVSDDRVARCPTPSLAWPRMSAAARISVNVALKPADNARLTDSLGKICTAVLDPRRVTVGFESTVF